MKANSLMESFKKEPETFCYSVYSLIQDYDNDPNKTNVDLFAILQQIDHRFKMLNSEGNPKSKRNLAVEGMYFLRKFCGTGDIVVNAFSKSTSRRLTKEESKTITSMNISLDKYRYNMNQFALSHNPLFDTAAKEEYKKIVDYFSSVSFHEELAKVEKKYYGLTQRTYNSLKRHPEDKILIQNILDRGIGSISDDWILFCLSTLKGVFSEELGDRLRPILKPYFIQVHEACMNVRKEIVSWAFMKSRTLFSKIANFQLQDLGLLSSILEEFAKDESLLSIRERLYEWVSLDPEREDYFMEWIDFERLSMVEKDLTTAQERNLAIQMCKSVMLGYVLKVLIQIDDIIPFENILDVLVLMHKEYIQDGGKRSLQYTSHNLYTLLYLDVVASTLPKPRPIPLKPTYAFSS